MPEIPQEEQQVIDQIFSEAIELAVEARPAFLDKACAGHPRWVREEVDCLLAHHQQAEADQDFLARSPVQIDEIPATSATSSLTTAISTARPTNAK